MTDELKASCPSCAGTGALGGNPSYGVCDDCNGTGWIVATQRLVDVPDIKLAIADFLEARDGDLEAISTDEERSASAVRLHDDIQAIAGRIR